MEAALACRRDVPNQRGREQGEAASRFSYWRGPDEPFSEVAETSEHRLG